MGMEFKPISEDDPFRPPTDAILAAEQRLGMKFNPDYRAFLQGGSDVANALLEPASIMPNAGHLDIFKMVDAAWNKMYVPKHLFPFVEDNGDYFCLTPLVK
jgi:hypothetical protein